MAENEILENQEQQTEDISAKYIDAINDLKRNSVSKDQYNKVLEENRNLLNSIVNGKEVATAEQPVEKKDINELRKELFYSKKNMSNLEYITKALELRDRVLEETGEDCFVGRGRDLVPTEEDYHTAQRVADIYRECIDYANGDSTVFTNELQRRTVDVGIPSIGRRK